MAAAYLFLVRWLASFVPDSMFGSPQIQLHMSSAALLSIVSPHAVCYRAFRHILIHYLGVASPCAFPESVGITSCVLYSPPPNQTMKLTATAMSFGDATFSASFLSLRSSLSPSGRSLSFSR